MRLNSLAWLHFLDGVELRQLGSIYRVHQKQSGRPDNPAFDILDERYARGEIDHEQYGQFKSDIGEVPFNRVGGLRRGLTTSSVNLG